MDYWEKQIELCKDIATKAHAGGVSCGATYTSYIDHPARVAAAFKNSGCICVAWLHDVLEATKVTYANLLEYGVDQDIADTVACMTHGKGESYCDYIHRVSKNSIARQVKIIDIVDNLIDRPTERQIVKYRNALLQLCGGEYNC